MSNLPPPVRFQVRPCVWAATSRTAGRPKWRTVSERTHTHSHPITVSQCTRTPCNHARCHDCAAYRKAASTFVQLQQLHCPFQCAMHTSHIHITKSRTDWVVITAYAPLSSTHNPAELCPCMSVTSQHSLPCLVHRAKG